MDMMGWWIYYPVVEGLVGNTNMFKERVCMVWA